MDNINTYDTNTLLTITKEYKDNKVIHVFCDNGKVYYKVYNSMLSFLIFGATKLGYNKTLKCFTAKTNTNILEKVYICDELEFRTKANRYHKRYHHNCYKAIYSEVLMSKVLNGKHNKANTKHGKGDIIVNNIYYEVKFGREVTL